MILIHIKLNFFIHPFNLISFPNKFIRDIFKLFNILLQITTILSLIYHIFIIQLMFKIKNYQEVLKFIFTAKNVLMQ